MITGCAKPALASPRAEHENQEVLNPASYKERGTHMLLVGNGRVITRDENNPYFQAGAVAIDGEKIVAVGGARRTLRSSTQVPSTWTPRVASSCPAW